MRHVLREVAIENPQNSAIVDSAATGFTTEPDGTNTIQVQTTCTVHDKGAAPDGRGASLNENAASICLACQPPVATVGPTGSACRGI